MISCYYKDIAEVECSWQGPCEDFETHLVSSHSVLEYTACKHNKIILELFLDLSSSGYRFVIISFVDNSLTQTCFFEEYFDEEAQIFKVLLRSANAQARGYKIAIQGKFSTMEFGGCVQGFEESPIESSQQCLQIFVPQIKRLAFIEENELRYKVVISLV